MDRPQKMLIFLKNTSIDGKALPSFLKCTLDLSQALLLIMNLTGVMLFPVAGSFPAGLGAHAEILCLKNANLRFNRFNRNRVGTTEPVSLILHQISQALPTLGPEKGHVLD